LLELGITNYYDLIFRDTKEKDYIIYKQNARKYFYDKGFFALMSIGDNKCDIGSYGGIGILI
jgi:hypothetical protein